MDIKWNQNPLKTEIYLDDNELEIFKLKIRMERLEQRLFETIYNIKEGKAEQSILTYDFLEDEDSAFEENVNLWVEELTGALTDKHCGDCTCIPCSCDKCHAESLLGINTISGLSKYEAHYIDVAFNEVETIDDALEYLKNYNPEPTENWMVDWISKWINNARGAHDWLKNYKKEHGF